MTPLDGIAALSGVIGFCVVLTVLALWMDAASDREWRARLHRIDRIRTHDDACAMALGYDCDCPDEVAA